MATFKETLEISGQSEVLLHTERRPLSSLDHHIRSGGGFEAFTHISYIYTHIYRCYYFIALFYLILLVILQVSLITASKLY